MAVLAAACGTPATGYHSERLPLDQVQTVHTTAASAGWAPVSIERSRRFKGLRLPVQSRVG
jgi:hypothetical protein